MLAWGRVDCRTASCLQAATAGLNSSGKDGTSANTAAALSSRPSAALTQLTARQPGLASLRSGASNANGMVSAKGRLPVSTSHCKDHPLG